MVVRSLLVLVSSLLLAAVCAPGAGDFGPGEGDAEGNPDAGRILFENGDGLHGRCIACHCADASGGCRMGAPDIRGKSVLEVNARTRDPAVPHGGGKFDLSDQDIADIAAYLQSLKP